MTPPPRPLARACETARARAHRTPPRGSWRFGQVASSITITPPEFTPVQAQWLIRPLKHIRRELVVIQRQFLLSRINGRRRRVPKRRVRIWTSRYTHRTRIEPAITGST